MNQYPSWKYLLIMLVVVVGVLYVLPNFYGDDPAVQITSSRGFELPDDISSTIDDALASEQIGYKASERIDNKLLFRFNSAQDQIAAANALQSRLGDSYIVALNMAHATPNWLRAIAGKPLTLGLDLQGGVHFLMEVDMETARAQQLDIASPPA